MPRTHLLILAASLLLAPSLNAQTPPAAAPSQQSLPAAIPTNGLQLWLAADHVKPSDGHITTIPDLSPNHNDATRTPDSTAPASDPTLIQDPISHQPVLHFTGENLAFTFPRVTGIRSAIWVVSKDPAAFGHRDERFVLGDTLSHDFHAGWTDDTIFNTVYDNPNPSGHLSKYLHDGKTYLNGEEMDASKIPFPQQLGVISIFSTGPVEANQLARDRSFGGRSWQGNIAEVILYNRELTWKEGQAVVAYLMAKYHIPTPIP
ncbi:MAG TPA: hypothetical protein VGU46_09345 [Acidobacteriaceae bacterium]|nr:hypothetical protein [Acidobacteriaceae bacterium]